MVGSESVYHARHGELQRDKACYDARVARHVKGERVVVAFKDADRK